MSEKPASVTVVASGTADASGLAASEGLRLLGYSVQEDAGTPGTAIVKLRDTASERQTISITGSPTGGTFTLTFGGDTTAAIAFDATAAAVQAALEALPSIGTGNVVCAGGALPGTAVTATFAGALAMTDVGNITGDGGLLTGGTAPAVSIAQNGFTGDVIAAISLAADGAETVWFGDRGIIAKDGIWVERISGTTVVSLYSVDD